MGNLNKDPEQLVQVHIAAESGYRRGYQQGINSGFNIVLALLEQNVTLEEIPRLLTIFDSRFVGPWRASDTWRMTTPPVFDLDKMRALSEELADSDESDL